jgi:signal transduction histidine kinase
MKRRLLFITTAFVLSLVIIIILTYRLYTNFTFSNSYNKSVEHTYKIILQKSELENFLKEAETGQRGYLLTGDSNYLAPYLSIRNNIKPSYDSLKLLTTGNVRQERALNKAGLMINNIVDQFQHSIYLFNTRDTAFKNSLDKSRTIMDTLRFMLKNIEEEELAFLHERSVKKELYQTYVPRYFWAIFLFAFIIFLVSFIVILKEFRQRVQYQQQLEQKIKETNAYNIELKQIAFATSHDLQEPLRRIQTFNDMLVTKYSEELDGEGRMIISRINHSAQRMQGLIEDLRNFSNLARDESELENINADELLKSVIDSLQEKIDQKNTVIHIGQMPAIIGYRRQLFLMFRSLLDNSIKFSKPAVVPVITIQWVKTTGQELEHIDHKSIKKEFIKISICDNGIGFDNEFRQKMFLIFQRLHNGVEYEGRGLGLAIVEHVMTNHNGYVSAKGEVNQGAVFNLYFPVREN